MSSTPPRVSGSPEEETWRRWAEERITEGENRAIGQESRVKAVELAATNSGSVAANAANAARENADRVVSPDAANRIARPALDGDFWNDVATGKRYLFERTNPQGLVIERSSWRNVTWNPAGAFVLQPAGTTEGAELHITPILPIPTSGKVYVEAEYPTASLRPQIWVEWRGADGALLNLTANDITNPQLVTSKTSVTQPKSGTTNLATNYSVKLVRQAGAGMGTTLDPKVFEVIGTGGLNISPEGISVEDAAGNKTVEINPSLPFLSAPSAPTLVSGGASVSVRWNGAMASGAAPANLAYVYAQESAASTGPWVRVGAALLNAGDIIVRPPVGSTRYYRFVPVDRAGRDGTASASASIVVVGVTPIDLGGELGDVISTVDGLNKIFFNLASDTPTAHAQGDLWYVVDEATRNVVGVRAWNGASWNDFQLVANSVIVPGSVGPIQLAEGAVTAPAISADALEGKTIKGAYIEGPTIASGPNLGVSNLLPDPSFSTAPDATWVASGHLGDATTTIQTDTITWDQTLSPTGGFGGTFRMRGSAVVPTTVSPVTRTAGSLMFRSTAGIFASTTRTVTNPWDYIARNKYPIDPSTDYSLTQVDAAPTGGTAVTRTTYLTNSGTASVTAGDSLRLEYEVNSPGWTTVDAALTVQLINATTSAVLWEQASPTVSLAGGALSLGRFVISLTPDFTANVKLRFKAVYQHAGGGLTRRITSGYVRRDTVAQSTPPASTPDFNQNLAGYALDPLRNPDYSLTPASTVNSQSRWGTTATASIWRRTNAKLNVTYASLGKLNPSGAGFLLTAEGGYQAFSADGSVTVRLDGDNNFFEGTIRTAESGQGSEITDTSVRVSPNLEDPTSGATLTSDGLVFISPSSSTGVNSSSITRWNMGGWSEGTEANRTLLANTPIWPSRWFATDTGIDYQRSPTNSSQWRRMQSIGYEGTDAERLTLPTAWLRNNLKYYSTDTDKNWLYRNGSWIMAEADNGAYLITPTSVTGTGLAISGSTVVATSMPTAGGNINGIFSTAFRSYNIVYTGSFSGGSGITFQLRTASATNTTANYLNQYIWAVGAGATQTAQNNITFFSQTATGGERLSSRVQLTNPATATPTSYLCDSTSLSGTTVIQTRMAGWHNVSSAYTGIAIATTSGADFTGTIQVYGNA